MQQTTLSDLNQGKLTRLSGQRKAFPIILPGQDQSDPTEFSPSIAHHLVNLMIQHWYACLASNEIRPDVPLDILDFSPGRGLTTLLMTCVLQRKIPGNSMFRWRYLPVSHDRQSFTMLRSVKGLQVLIEEGRVVPLLWHLDRKDPCLLLPNARQSWQPFNPVIVLMHDYFSRLPQRLLAAHYGKLMEYRSGSIAVDLNTEIEDQNGQSKDWSQIDVQALDNDLIDLFSRYLAKFNSAPVPYPEGALRLIELIKQKCKRGCFMISTAQGLTNETSLRLGSFTELTKILHKKQTFPINFHLLAHKLRACDAITDHANLQNNQVMQLALFQHHDSVSRITSLVQSIDLGMFGHAPALSEAMQAVTGDSVFEHRLTLLRLSAFDPKVLAAIHGPHFSKASKLPNFNRFAWQEALDQVWENYFPFDKKDSFLENISFMAMHCGHWSLARRVLLSGLQQRGPNANDLAQLAWCDARTGQLMKAKERVTDALKIDPGHSLAIEICKRIEKRLSGWDNRYRQAIDHPELPLLLEPLDDSHAEVMLNQYRDPQIAIMTGLPAINSLEGMQGWIDEQLRENNWAHFAIVHKDQGFVGYINLAISDHAAFFCFWTGVDFQGRGLATQAGKLACDFAHKSGINVILTSAYSDNQRSIRALQRIGFEEISIRALPPDHERIFYVLKSASSTDIDDSAELIDYYAREKISLKFSVQ